MTIVSLADIQRDPDAVLRRVERGETVRIVRGTVPVAEITPVPPPAAAAQPASVPSATNGAPKRPFGLCAGEFATPQNFDAPLPDHVIREFEQ